MVSVGAGALRSLQSMAAPRRSTSKPSQNMACGWLNWIYFARIARSFPAIRTPKCRSSEKYGLWGKRSLNRSRAGLVTQASAYGGLLSCTLHVLISLLGFMPSPDQSCLFRQVEIMIIGALFFMPSIYTLKQQVVTHLYKETGFQQKSLTMMTLLP